MEAHITLDYLALAAKMAEEEFKRDFEEKFPFTELYEQLDDSGKWYLKPDYQMVYSAIEEGWKECILDFQQERVESFIHAN